jgi:hypothetical protein
VERSSRLMNRKLRKREIDVVLTGEESGEPLETFYFLEGNRKVEAANFANFFQTLQDDREYVKQKNRIPEKSFWWNRSFNLT